MKPLNWEKTSFDIIAALNKGKASAIEAIDQAKLSNFTQSYLHLEIADKKIAEANNLHSEIVHAGKENQLIDGFSRAQAGDQLLSIQTLILMAKEIVAIYLLLFKKLM